MKRCYRNFLLRDAYRSHTEENDEPLPALTGAGTLASGSERNPRLLRRNVRIVVRAARFISTMERRGESTAMIRVHLLAHLATMRRTARIDQRAGTYDKRYGRLMQKVRDLLDQLPSPRRLPAARRQEQIGNDNYPDCWENYVYEQRLLRARDKHQRRKPFRERVAELIDGDDRRERMQQHSWCPAA